MEENEKIIVAEIVDEKVDDAKQEAPKAEEAVVESPAREKREASLSEEEQDKKTLIAFILSVAAFTVGFGWFVGGIAGVVLGIISLMMVKPLAPTRNPYRIFRRIAYPVAIVDIVVGAIMTVVYLITFIVGLVH